MYAFALVLIYASRLGYTYLVVSLLVIEQRPVRFSPAAEITSIVCIAYLPFRGQGTDARLLTGWKQVGNESMYLEEMID